MTSNANHQLLDNIIPHCPIDRVVNQLYELINPGLDTFYKGKQFKQI